MIEANSVLSFSLSMQPKDADSYYIGNRQLNEYIEVPLEAIDIISLFDNIRSVEEVIELYHKDHDDPVDVLDFVRDLAKLNMVYRIDGEVVGPKDVITPKPISKAIGKILFSKVALCIYVALFLASLIIIVTNSKHIINTNYSVLFPEFFGISFLCYTVASWGIIFFHELGHYFAAISIDIPVKFKLSLRYLFLVVEADINGVWAVPKSKRYIVYFAGMCSDTTWLFLALLGKFWIPLPPLMVSVCNMVVLLICLSLIQQFMLFARTDLYYVLLTALNVNGLHMYIPHFIRSHILKTTEKSDEYSSTQVGLFFTLSVVGLVFAGISTYLNFKIIFKYLAGGIQEIMHGKGLLILDGLCAIVISIINLVLWLSGFRNFYRQYKNDKALDE